MIDPEVLYGHYIYTTSGSVGLQKHFSKYAADVIDKIGLSEDSLVLDLGSNDGLLLNEFKRNGMRVVGVEPAPSIAEYANNKGLETVNAFFNEVEAAALKKEKGSFDLITANNVFANIDNIYSWMKGVDILLKEDGIFVFESYYLQDVIDNFVFDLFIMNI